MIHSIKLRYSAITMIYTNAISSPLSNSNPEGSYEKNKKCLDQCIQIL